MSPVLHVVSAICSDRMSCVDWIWCDSVSVSFLILLLWLHLSCGLLFFYWDELPPAACSSLLCFFRRITFLFLFFDLVLFLFLSLAVLFLVSSSCSVSLLVLCLSSLLSVISFFLIFFCFILWHVDLLYQYYFLTRLYCDQYNRNLRTTIRSPMPSFELIPVVVHSVSS